MIHHDVKLIKSRAYYRQCLARRVNLEEASAQKPGANIEAISLEELEAAIVANPGNPYADCNPAMYVVVHGGQQVNNFGMRREP